MDITENILFEDTEILVCRKYAGIAVQTRKLGEQDMESLLRNYRAGKGETPYIGVVHRLDQPVEGILVFAKNPRAAAALSRQLQQDGFGKYYRGVVWGEPPQEEGRLEDVLQKDGRTNMSRVVSAGTKGGKRAVLDYKVLERQTDTSLVEIRLYTGRHHQIRVQLAHAGCPLMGDRKYGNTASPTVPLALCACRLAFRHPISGETLMYQVEPEGAAFLPYRK
ncbi:MAG: RNA pseudouridine synthase [Lachnospiraceae bacterium]|nr:RNA pseudouridine synthase [Lachnospiraceae bacterium]MDE7435987.1 RNA pseudouridine synthase [Lachnospiraceae bacterium]